jgi:hypothetical protein
LHYANFWEPILLFIFSLFLVFLANLYFSRCRVPKPGLFPQIGFSNGTFANVDGAPVMAAHAALYAMLHDERVSAPLIELLTVSAGHVALARTIRQHRNK